MTLKYYAGIGSRETPLEIQDLMRRISAYAEEKNFVLRSGAAQGADTAFESGVSSKNMMQIFIPWRSFSNKAHHRYAYASPEIEKQAHEIAANFHPNWNACTNGAKALHARNVLQILGPYLDLPVNLVICWTKGASRKGGTGQALRIAHELNIPIFDLGIGEDQLVNVCHQIKEMLDHP